MIFCYAIHVYQLILHLVFKMLAIRLPAEIEARLTTLAERTGRTKTFYAKEAILQYMNDLEDAYLAAERLEQSNKRWSQDDLEQNLDLER